MPGLPYVSPAEFRAHPTFLDLDNLRVGDVSLADQNAELGNILLMASAWADSYVGGEGYTLAAHTRTDSKRMRVDRAGRLLVHPDHIPARALTSVACGVTLGTMTTYTNPAVQIEDGREMVIELAGTSFSWSGSLQFGPPGAGAELYVRATYVAGYAHTTIVGAPGQAATSITVADPTGIYPGDVLRIWEPGSEEAVTVASTYVPGQAAVPLAAGLAFGHTTGAGVSGLPADARLAVTNYAAATLSRPATAKEDSFPDSRTGPGTRKADARRDGSGLLGEAQRLLRPLRRVR